MSVLNHLWNKLMKLLHNAKLFRLLWSKGIFVDGEKFRKSKFRMHFRVSDSLLESILHRFQPMMWIQKLHFISNKMEEYLMGLFHFSQPEIAELIMNGFWRRIEGIFTQFSFEGFRCWWSMCLKSISILMNWLWELIN